MQQKETKTCGRKIWVKSEPHPAFGFRRLCLTLYQSYSHDTL